MEDAPRSGRGLPRSRLSNCYWCSRVYCSAGEDPGGDWGATGAGDPGCACGAWMEGGAVSCFLGPHTAQMSSHPKTAGPPDRVFELTSASQIPDNGIPATSRHMAELSIAWREGALRLGRVVYRTCRGRDRPLPAHGCGLPWLGRGEERRAGGGKGGRGPKDQNRLWQQERWGAGGRILFCGQQVPEAPPTEKNLE